MESSSSQAKQGKKLTPSAITDYLNQYVVGQDEAKKTLSVALYSHYRRVGKQRGDVDILKSNILLIGPTGTGKTLLCETLSRIVRVPFVTANATSLAQSKYVNEEIEALMQRLLEKADGDVAKAQRGIVFIDEIDKLKATEGGEQRGTSGERVQHALLKIMEGAPVRLGSAQTIDTTNILFICAGAFVGLDVIASASQSFGFISVSDSEDQHILDRLNSRVKPTDLFKFGLIPEFAGRLPVIANLQQLSKEMLARIMVEPRNSIYNQFREILKDEGVELVIDPEVFRQIAEMAFEYKVGARSLRGIFEEMLMPVLYQVPDRPDARKVLIKSLFEEPSLITG